MARTIRRKNVKSRYELRHVTAWSWDRFYEERFGYIETEAASYQPYRDDRKYGLPEENLKWAKRMANYDLHRETHLKEGISDTAYAKEWTRMHRRLGWKHEVRRCLDQGSFDDYLDVIRLPSMIWFWD